MNAPDTLVKQLAKGYVYVPDRASGGQRGLGNRAAENHLDNPVVAATCESYFDDPDRLHGDKLPSQTIIREKPIHRMMIYLHAQGAGIRDIAEQTGYTYVAVQTILSQPWARQRLVQILNECGRDRVKHFLTHEVAPSLEVLREVRDNPDAKEASRIAAANSILDRALGKPTVHVETDNTSRIVPADVSRLDAEIEAVRKQLAEKGADSAPGQS